MVSPKYELYMRWEGKRKGNYTRVNAWDMANGENAHLQNLRAGWEG